MKKNPNLERSLLADIEAIEIRELAKLGLEGTTLIVAPHPDDESLACGGIIALLRNAGRDVRVVIVSDGSASHLNSPSHPPEKLASLRKDETLKALAILGVGKAEVTFMGFPDGKIAHPWDGEFDQSGSQDEGDF